MIKHIVFTDHSLAKVFCYDLAKTLTLSQLRAGTLAYSSVQSHPTDPSLSPNGEKWITETYLNGVLVVSGFTARPDLQLTSTPTIRLGNIYFSPTAPIKMRNVRMSYWERV
ncbi:MAG: hypothetical protein R8M45_05715 [Ghiorsea sp.]